MRKPVPVQRRPALAVKSQNSQTPFSFLAADFTKARLGLTDISQCRELFLAMLLNGFKSKVRFEALYSRKGVIAWEALAHPGTANSTFSIQKIADQAYKLGLHLTFDALTIDNALRYARGYFPVTLNISPKSALAPEFWEDATKGILKRLARYNPKEVIFEILEHDLDPKTADTLHLAGLKGMGYRFALDDFANTAADLRRLQVFGDLIDFIKIDGKFLQELYHSDPAKLCKLIRDIKDIYHNIQIVAEHVRHFDQAEFLFEMGADAVQGWNLNEEEYQRRYKRH